MARGPRRKNLFDPELKTGKQLQFCNLPFPLFLQSLPPRAAAPATVHREKESEKKKHREHGTTARSAATATCGGGHGGPTPLRGANDSRPWSVGPRTTPDPTARVRPARRRRADADAGSHSRFGDNHAAPLAFLTRSPYLVLLRN